MLSSNLVIPENLIENKLPLLWEALNVILELVLNVNSDSSKNLNVLLENTIKLSLSATDTLELKSYVFPVSFVKVINSFWYILIKNTSSELSGAVVKSIKVLVAFKV